MRKYDIDFYLAAKFKRTYLVSIKGIISTNSLLIKSRFELKTKIRLKLKLKMV